jgi:hypothetical protein
MENMAPWLIIVITVAIVVVIELLVLSILTGGNFSRLGLAWQTFRKVLGDPSTADKVRAILTPPPPEPPRPPRLSGEPLRLLAVLQREARLLDFLLEDISGADDAQLSAGVRELHKKSQAAIHEHLTLDPVLPGQEEQTVDVPAGFDPSAITLTGNVTGSPPFKGVLKHHGWRVKAYKLPAPPPGVDDLVVAPAEVELP